uniref:TOG domain-containing protein n=1 Tax=Plectus sambesii TaxID=2011161 RepID=A0A914UVT5_9BILA
MTVEQKEQPQMDLREVLKAFAVNVSSSSVNDQQKFIVDLASAISATKEPLPEPAIKGILKLLTPVAIFRYSQKESHRLVAKLFNTLQANNRDVTVKQLADTLISIFGSFPGASATEPIGKRAYLGVKWITAALQQRPFGEWTKETFSAATSALVVCCFIAMASDKAAALVVKKLSILFKKQPGYLGRLLETVKAMDSGSTPEKTLCLIAAIIRAAPQDATNWMTVALDFYVKGVLLPKVRPPHHVIVVSGAFLKYATHDIFKETLLPTMKKAMLRSPEIAVHGISNLLAQVKIELSSYAADILKSLSGQLISANDEIRDCSVAAVGALAKQCSEADCVKQLLKSLFAVLGGSEGKLTTAALRISVINATEALSQHTVSGADNVDSISQLAVEQYAALLKQEAHEGTSVALLNALCRWAVRFSNTLPPELITLFKNGLKPTSGSSGVRQAYLNCMIGVYQKQSVLSSLNDMAEQLQAIFDAGQKQAAQTPAVLESLGATVLLLKLFRVDRDNGASDRFTKVWRTAIDNQLFTKERFIGSLDDKGVLLLVEFLERILLDRPIELGGDGYPQDLCRALIVSLVWPLYIVRKKAKAAVARFLLLLDGVHFSTKMLNEFLAAVEEGWIENILTKARQQRVVATTEETGGKELDSVMSGKILCDCVVTLTKVEDSAVDDGIRQIGIASLLPCCLPAIVEYEGRLWMHVLSSLTKGDYHSLLHNHAFAQAAREKIFAHPSLQVAQNAVRLLVSLGADGGASRFEIWRQIDHDLMALDWKPLLAVTNEQVAIWKYPEGQLYDTSVIENNADDALDGRNMKRESKAYSFKEQMADLELRKELAAKRKNDGEKKLTPKQKTAMADQLKKESEVRARLNELYADVERPLSLFAAAVRGNPSGGVARMKLVLNVIVPLLKSPLVFDQVADCWLAIRDAGFDPTDDHLHDLVAYCSMRALGAAHVNEAWTEESLTNQIARTLQLLTDHCPDLKEEPSAAGRNLRLSPAAFAFTFPLLNAVLTHKSSSESLRIRALDFIEYHLDTEIIPANQLHVLPLDALVTLLTTLLANSAPGPVQHGASVCALNLAEVVDATFAESGVDLSELIEITVNSLQNESRVVREYVLNMLLQMRACLPSICAKNEQLRLLVVRRLAVARQDPEENCVKLASQLWHEAKFELDVRVCTQLLEDVISPMDFARDAASKALQVALREYPDQISPVLVKLGNIYEQKNELAAPIMDEVGRIVSEARDFWEARAGVASALVLICPLLPDNLVNQYFDIIIPRALMDRNTLVRDRMRDAAVEGVKEFGESHLDTLLPKFEQLLDDAPDVKSYDPLRQALVVLLGTLAKHLDHDDPKVRAIVARLIETLSTPSQQVQEAVSKCLSPLVPAIKDQAKELSTKLLWLLLEADNYGERRGAAYGIAGLVKGLGIVSLRELQIMPTLQDAIAEKKNAKHREGALIALEMLCTTLGKLFEPYIVQILPSLLICFGDSDPHVRKAAEDTSKAIMRQLSAHGVKLVLPSLLAALQEDSWRTKCGSVELLGAMAYCAPKQLSACLPNIVPRLIEVLADTHVKVQKAGEQALKQIGGVIRNPEIQVITQWLLSALLEPTTKTAPCLQKLVQTKFVHYIDAPSLALIMPIVRRAFDDRSTETRRVAGQIIANIYSLTDQKDIEPYLGDLIPGLKKSLLDPVPEIRAVAAKALGSMVASASGDTSVELREQIIPWLKERLVSDTTSVDRAGAAQGLCEVLGALGESQLAAVMPDVIRTAESEEVTPAVRDGYVLMYIYLPMVFGDKFTPYLPRVVPSLLKALADESEFVRESALKAGQRLINTYCVDSKRLLLPQLERGLFDDSWRIRHASVTLMGDFLFKISGVSGKMTTATQNDDDTFGMETASKTILRELGQESRDRVLSGLYIARSDVALHVRQAAGHVWKIVVANTPRTLKEIMKTLFELLLGCLASSSEEKQQIAARCLGELVKKMGERILIEVVPVLEEGLKSDHADQRQGVCIALQEIISNTTKDVVLMYSSNLVPTVRTALYDPLPEVRNAAASTFDALHQSIGNAALEDILTPLLEQLDDPVVGEATLDGLRSVMEVKSRVVLPYLVPKLTTPPINTLALSKLSAVAGDALTKHLSKILDALLVECSNKMGTNEEQHELALCLDVLLSVTNTESVELVLGTLLQRAHKTNNIPSAILLAKFCQNTKVPLNEFTDQLLHGALLLYVSPVPAVVEGAIGALMALTQALDQREQLDAVPTIKHAVAQIHTTNASGVVPGFADPKGLQPLLPMIREGILSGGADMKETAGDTLGQLIGMSELAALKPHVVNITGPLIRVLGDRYPAPVKISILSTLALLLDKVTLLLKPFLPQLQSTFLPVLRLKAWHFGWMNIGWR